jgi:hypothetical protein
MAQPIRLGHRHWGKPCGVRNVGLSGPGKHRQGQRDRQERQHHQRQRRALPGPPVLVSLPRLVGPRGRPYAGDHQNTRGGHGQQGELRRPAGSATGRGPRTRTDPCRGGDQQCRTGPRGGQPEPNSAVRVGVAMKVVTPEAGRIVEHVSRRSRRSRCHRWRKSPCRLQVSARGYPRWSSKRDFPVTRWAKPPDPPVGVR